MNADEAKPRRQPAPGDEIDNRALIARAKSGDREAFGRLVDAHYDFIYRIAFKWLGERSDSEDIAQDAVVRLAAALQGFDGRSAFRTWLYTLVLNLVRDRQRRSARRRRGAAELADWTLAAMPVQQAAAESADLWQAVRALPQKQRDAVLLVYAEELSHAEAAVVMGCRETTISWHLHQARKTLKQVM